nr:hypothetical protein [Candidatus Sigynarchaeota archaeon]
MRQAWMFDVDLPCINSSTGKISAHLPSSASSGTNGYIGNAKIAQIPAFRIA